jgi:hypothetical protein
VALVGADEGSRWVAAAKRTKVACVAEIMKAAAQATGGKSLEDTDASLAQPEMELEVGGRRVQPYCEGLRLAKDRECSPAKVCSMLLERWPAAHGTVWKRC